MQIRPVGRLLTLLTLLLLTAYASINFARIRIRCLGCLISITAIYAHHAAAWQYWSVGYSRAPLLRYLIAADLSSNVQRLSSHSVTTLFYGRMNDRVHLIVAANIRQQFDWLPAWQPESLA